MLAYYLQFTEECLKIALAYCLDPSLQVRVFGLYLIYGLYFKYPFIPRVKVWWSADLLCKLEMRAKSIYCSNSLLCRAKLVLYATDNVGTVVSRLFVSSITNRHQIICNKTEQNRHILLNFIEPQPEVQTTILRLPTSVSEQRIQNLIDLSGKFRATVIQPDLWALILIPQSQLLL